MQLCKRITVVGNGNIDVGNKTATGKPGAPKSERARICGAMTQQSCDSGRVNQSSPQKFVQLVGYRDPKARPEPGVDPHPAPVKR
jgi:hypothetical protein